jgi:hypothetical protein
MYLFVIRSQLQSQEMAVIDSVLLIVVKVAVSVITGIDSVPAVVDEDVVSVVTAGVSWISVVVITVGKGIGGLWQS